MFDTCAECGSKDAGHIPLSDYFCVSAALDRTKRELEGCRRNLHIETTLLYEYKAKAESAEERGRRSGVEEADGTVRSAVRLALACAAEIADSIDNIVTRRVIARRIRALIPPPQGNTVWPDPAHDGVVERLRVAIDAALAPRDSGKEGQR